VRVFLRTNEQTEERKMVSNSQLAHADEAYLETPLYRELFITVRSAGVEAI